VACLQVADSVGGCGTAYLHESLVGIIFGLQKCGRRLVPVSPTDFHVYSCHIGHPALHTFRGRRFASACRKSCLIGGVTRKSLGPNVLKNSRAVKSACGWKASCYALARPCRRRRARFVFRVCWFPRAESPEDGEACPWEPAFQFNRGPGFRAGAETNHRRQVASSQPLKSQDRHTLSRNQTVQRIQKARHGVDYLHARGGSLKSSHDCREVAPLSCAEFAERICSH